MKMENNSASARTRRKKKPNKFPSRPSNEQEWGMTPGDWVLLKAVPALGLGQIISLIRDEHYQGNIFCVKFLERAVVDFYCTEDLIFACRGKRSKDWERLL